MEPSAQRQQVNRFATSAWILILVIICAVQIFRPAYLDALIFAIAIVALVADAVGVIPGSVRARRLPPGAVVLVGLIAIAATLIFVPRHSVVSGAIVALIGTAAIAFAWPDRPASARDEWTRPVKRSGVLWAAVAVATCLWELAMYLLGSFAPSGRDNYPALSDLLDPLADGALGKAAFVVIWLLVGLFLTRRVVSR
ncbi:MAG: hypothetical protein EPN91_00815 [Salinibacterium sp.]|nr:MAG: hypothetical protein EPN91_00815 [Salinibacterium sp.]